ncbi:MAG TPA: nucleoside-diphosphate kinase [Bryobacteraceae bacterium]|jgi:nucleoside-diphosphate kinase|nr:nucleoside-diphosphate kinase [Bryobacteraceae bacterium]
MSVERTFSIIKPDAVGAGQTGEILAMIQQAGFRILAMRMTRLTEAQAQAFYAVHRERPFFGGLVKFMTEGPVVVMALEREDAVKKLREVMGATNPANAAEGTIRKRFAANIERNCVHGSDAPETAETELRFFFSTSELI